MKQSDGLLMLVLAGLGYGVYLWTAKSTPLPSVDLNPPPPPPTLVLL
jgi:hypothetical protein